MTQHPAHGDRLRVSPPLDAADRRFLAGFSPRPGEVAQIWPGQPVVPSPWKPCEVGCCLLLVPTRTVAESAGQWLRFLAEQFLRGRHRLDGQVLVPRMRGRASTLLIVEAGDVFEGQVTVEDADGSAGLG